MELTQDIVKELLNYDSETGKFFWKKRDLKWFDVDGLYGAQHSQRKWNTRFAGKEAFVSKRRNYLFGTLFGKPYSSHHIAWLYVYGALPPRGMEIDHINGIYADNRISNLRLVTPSQNQKNKRLASNCKYGVYGVLLCSQTGKWRAHIRNGKTVESLGRFQNFDDAVAARKAAELKYGFHQNHGRT